MDYSPLSNIRQLNEMDVADSLPGIIDLHVTICGLHKHYYIPSYASFIIMIVVLFTLLKT